MQDSSCCCKHSTDKTNDDCKSESTVGVAVVTSLLPHFFCCFMPLIFTAFIGGTMAVFFHDYWFVVTSVVALLATLIIYKIRNVPMSVMNIGGNVAIALAVAFAFNFMFHPEHDYAHEASQAESFQIAEHAHSH